jgi:hypothetical protein
MSVDRYTRHNLFTGFLPLFPTLYFPLSTTEIVPVAIYRPKKSPFLTPTEPLFSLCLFSSEKHTLMVLLPWTDIYVVSRSLIDHLIDNFNDHFSGFFNILTTKIYTTNNT